MDIAWLDWFGYAASAVILISLTMSSIIRLRWVNLAGAVMFAVFGYMIGSIPTGTLNAGIVVIDIYYLVRLYRERDELAIVRADPSSELFTYLWKTNLHDIKRFAGDVTVTGEHDAFYYLRNNNTAGILVGTLENDAVFRIHVDYVTPEYRDFRIGEHLFSRGHIRDALPQVERVVAHAGNAEHASYLERLGFVSRAQDLYEKEIA